MGNTRDDTVELSVQKRVSQGLSFLRLTTSDTGFLATLGLGADYQWTQKAGFRLDARLLVLNGVVTSGWTLNGQVLWGATFSF